MKSLYIVRHGKASQQMMPDIKRPLIEKGIKRTRKRAKTLKKLDIKPDLIVSSPAVRAYQTAKIFAEILDYPTTKIDLNTYFYFHPLESVLHQLYALPNQYNTVFITGHNPVWTELADLFSQKDIIHLRTSGVVGVQFQVKQWENISTQNVKKTIIIN